MKLRGLITAIALMLVGMTAFAQEGIIQEAQFPGGAEAFVKYLSTEVEYPKQSMDNGEDGIVYIRVAISEKGEVSNPEVLRGISETLDNSALKAVKNMPNWIPAKDKDGNVASTAVIPISFRLN